ncbi:MAG: prepilin-type N-terminal cleavage/methylation domain-containing protein [Candidatus Pacebacteria bacterium]|nr:prepilin-type N-terminal cleavage/methylation domain-containing protein [Candidatus Paceibacterota bacterium]
MNNKGFTLIEVLLAVFIITVAVLGLYNGINYSYRSVESAKEIFVASYLAEEGVELVKNIRDSNFVTEGATWTNGLLSCSSSYGCRMDYNDSALTVNNSDADSKIALWTDANGFYNYVASGTKTIFARKIVITNEVTRLKVVVTVYYGDEEFILQQYLYDWK